jgi:DNA polymerase V
MQGKRIAIVDCNNFYVSCERLFNPALKTVPTVVLSNNDGCIIARSQEIKDMGIRMGQPLFQLEEPVQQEMVKFSSNYELYGDISDRIAKILARFTDHIEVYSIDESFLDLTHIPESELRNYMSMIRDEVLRLTGIPVSIGAGPNKTLAKLTNAIAKKDKSRNGVCHTGEVETFDKTPVEDVWGIGSRWAKKLAKVGTHNVGDFKRMQAAQVKRMLTVVGLRTWMELNGHMVHEIKTDFKRPATVTSSRSFGKTTWQKEQVGDAIWTFLEDANSKMRNEGLKARRLTVFAVTNRFSDDRTYWSRTVTLHTPTNDTQSMWNEVGHYIEDLPLRLWARAGVAMNDLVPEGLETPKLFDEEHPHRERPKVDAQLWMTRREFMSEKRTTDWSDVPKIW